MVDEVCILLKRPFGCVEGSCSKSRKHGVVTGLQFFLEVSSNLVSVVMIEWHVDPAYEKMVSVWVVQMQTHVLCLSHRRLCRVFISRRSSLLPSPQDKLNHMPVAFLQVGMRGLGSEVSNFCCRSKAKAEGVSTTKTTDLQRSFCMC